MYAHTIADLSTEQLLKIPPGFKNNILWNVGHVVVAQQMICYRLSSVPMYVDDALVAQFKNGTSPETWSETPDIDRIKGLLLDLPDRFVADYEAGKFTAYHTYTTSTGVELDSFDKGTAFNLFHEGLHLGVIMALKKLV